MTEFTGRGDPARSLELLWGLAPKPGRRGPKLKLDIRRIGEVAIVAADADGLAAVSMRRVADALGVSPMALYTYTPSKAELIDVMVDTATAELVADLGPSPSADWREALEAYARALWRQYERHPWLLEVAPARGTLGPNSTTAYEHAMRATEGLDDLGARERASVVSLVDSYVRGAAGQASAAASAPAVTGQTDEEWWAERAPLFERLFDPDRFPALVAAHEGGAFAGDAEDYDLVRARDDFEFGLARVLDGLAALRGRAR